MIPRRALPLLVALLAWPAVALPHAMDVVRGDPDRRLLLDAIRPSLERATEGPVRFGVLVLRRFGAFAFGVLQPRRPERVPIDWSTTAYRDRAGTPPFQEGRTFVLWRRLAGGWKVEEQAVAPAEAVWRGWQRRHGLPMAMFDLGELL